MSGAGTAVLIATLPLGNSTLPGILASSSTATLAFLAINALTVGAFLVCCKLVRAREFAAVTLQSIVATTVFNIPVVAGIAFLYVQSGAWVLPFVFIPLVLAQYFHGLYHKKATLTEELLEVNATLARANLQFAAAMVHALDARDAYTAGHSAAVAVYCRDIAREAGMDEEMQTRAHLAGLLHDIGKIGVPGSVLNKQAKLDDEEYELMKQHAAIGADILAEVDSYAEISALVRSHHERMDGRGYPDQLTGDQIPDISRIISVADTYSAMTTDRPYRKGMPTEKAMSILGEAAGDQLDPAFTEAFLMVLARESDAYQRGKLGDFDVEMAKHQAKVAAGVAGDDEAPVIQLPSSQPSDSDAQPEAA